jgi:hypothetical protein
VEDWGRGSNQLGADVEEEFDRDEEGICDENFIQLLIQNVTKNVSSLR